MGTVIGRTTDDAIAPIPTLRGMTSRPDPVRCPLLIGRDDLLDLADRRLTDVQAGRGQFLLVSGEAGIGKTRFLDAIDQMASERGFTAAWGDLAPQDANVPAASILDLARTMARIPGFASAGGELIRLGGIAMDAGGIRRRQLVMDVVEVLIGSVDGPTFFGFEDLQWADDLSLEIIAELARRGRDHHLLICGSYRTDEAPIGTYLRDWRSRLVTQRYAEEVRLRPLDETETALVTTLLLGTGLPAPRDVAAAVFERTDGIPLHIEELLGALSADARANGYAIREARVPDTIEDAVNSRLAHRSAAAQAVARAGAVIGRCFVPEVLAGIMDLPPESLDAPLQELIDHGVLWPPGDRGLFDFRHQLLRDAVYRRVPSAERRRFHARAGEFGAELEGQSEIHASLHYERAGLRRRAFETALSGARAAARMSAHREAYELYRRAVANLPDDVGPSERAGILEAAAGEATTVEDYPVAVTLADAASRAYHEAGEPVHAIAVRLLIENLRRRDAEPTLARLASLTAISLELDRLPEGRDVTAARADVESLRALAHLERRAMPEALSALATVRRLGETLGDPDLTEFADVADGMIATIDGRVREGIETIARVAVTAEREGREESGVTAYRNAGYMALLSMDYAAASRMLDAGRRYADAIEQSHCAHVMAGTSAGVAWADGRWTDAVTEAGQAMADRGCRRGAEIARWALAYTALGRGETAAATAELLEGWRFGITAESLEMTLPPLWGLAELALQTGDFEPAIERCRDADRRARVVDERVLLVPFVVTGVRAFLGAGRPSDAGSWMTACAAYLGAIPEVASAALEHGTGLVRMAEGSTGIARSNLEAAVRGWDAVGRVWESTWARLDLAQCLVRSNLFADALALAVEARAVASRLDARPLAERADALQRMARGRVAVEEPWRPLTSREFAVARLISQGLTNGEIADALGIAPKTASAHVEHILAKLGAARRAEIATWTSHVEGVATSS